MTSNARSQKQDALHTGSGEATARNRNHKPASTEQAEKKLRWQAENADAIRAENEYIEKYGLPLAKYRLF